MKRFIAYLIIMMLAPISILAQERTVENRPYTDLRPFHFGVLVGTHLQDLELNNVGPQTYINEDGIEMPCQVAVDQDRWDVGFTVGVAAEVRLSSLIQFRLAPTMYFGSRHLTYKNILESQAQGKDVEERQDMKTAYIGTTMDFIFAAPRFNNHRPYLLAGVNPIYNLSGSKEDYIKLKKSDLMLELGVGCDFYLPFFKLRPELKFMFGLNNVYDKKHQKDVKDKNTLPYTLSANQAKSKMIALTFYFE